MIDVEHLFKYHAPSDDQIPKYEVIRAAAKTLANVILNVTPPGPDQTTAIRKLREAVFTANAAIALQGRGM